VKHFTYIILLVLLIWIQQDAIAQYTFFTPDDAFAIEVSLPNSDLERLPIYQNAITSLAVCEDDIIGGTSATLGKNPYIFTASLEQRKVIKTYDLEAYIAGQQQIPTGFCQGSNDRLFAGTIPNFDQDNAGHILQVQRMGNGHLQIKNMGSPIEGEGILALVINEEKTMLFGITYPSGYFFTYDISSGSTEKYDAIAPTASDLTTYENFALNPDRYLCRALVVDDTGLVYGSAPINRIFTFNPTTRHFEFIEQTLPEVWGRKSMSTVESWTKDENGLIYGGNAGDGILFQLDPKLQTIKNLGKPIMMNRMQGLTHGADHKIYGIAGGYPGYSHLFSYDQTSGFKDLGNPEFVMKAPGIEQGILWRGFQLQTIASSENGKYIVMGEKESLSQLLVFPVE